MDTSRRTWCRWLCAAVPLVLALHTARAGDDIDLTLAVDTMPGDVTLQWTGGTPSFEVLRGSAAASLVVHANLQSLTPGSAWDEPLQLPEAGAVQFYKVVEAGEVTGTFPGSWINGASCGSEPAIQVHAYNPDTYILRQSLCTNFEGPFIYLLFGEDRVLMQDTGAGGVAIGATVYGIIDQWLVDNDRESIELIVTHSHAHGDHTQGDAQFQGQPSTTVVGLGSSQVSNFFGITNWPTENVTYDLGGGRVIDVMPIPGHQSAHIALFDRRAGLLFTGDTLYPGRCYISSFSQYLASIGRLTTFLSDKRIAWVLGTHIEMTDTPFVDYAFGATVHLDEHVLQLTQAHVTELHNALLGMTGSPHIEDHADFIVYPF